MGYDNAPQINLYVQNELTKNMDNIMAETMKGIEPDFAQAIQPLVEKIIRVSVSLSVQIIEENLRKVGLVEFDPASLKPQIVSSNHQRTE